MKDQIRIAEDEVQNLKKAYSELETSIDTKVCSFVIDSGPDHNFD